jgi:hypothetical protein
LKSPASSCVSIRVARFIVNANHGIIRAAAVFRVSDGVRNGVWAVIPQPTEWQRIAGKIDAAMIFARADFINVFDLSHRVIAL